MKAISFIVLFMSGVLITVGSVIYFTEDKRKRSAVLDSLEKARKAKKEKAEYLKAIENTEFEKDLEEEIKSLDNTKNESDAS